MAILMGIAGDMERGSSRATGRRPEIHAGAFPKEVQAWIPALRFAAAGMTVRWDAIVKA